MLVAVLASLAGLVTVLLALYRDREPLPAPPGPRYDWAPIPAPADYLRIDFPLAFPGYDPASVEQHLDALARAYGDLLAVTPPEVLERARARAVTRTGLDGRGPVADAEPGDGAQGGGVAASAEPDTPPAVDDVPTVVGDEQPVDHDAEALRAEAALFPLRSKPDERP